MWLDTLKIKAISWSTQSSDPLIKKIPSRIIIGLIGITAGLIEVLSYLSPTRVNHTSSPQASVDLRTRSVATEIFGLLYSDDDAIAKIKFTSISKELPILDGKKIEQTLSQDDFGSTKLPDDFKNIPSLQEFIQQFPTLTTADAVLSQLTYLEGRKKNLLEDLSQLEQEKLTAVGNQKIEIQNQINHFKNQLTTLNKEIQAFNNAFKKPDTSDFFKLEDLLDDSLEASESEQLQEWIYEKTNGLDGFTIDWLKSQEDCPEKTRLLKMIDDFTYHPAKRLQRLKLEHEAVTAFERFKEERNLKVLSFENIRQFELEDPQNHAKFIPILKQQALNMCLSECERDSNRRQHLTIELDNGPDQTPTILKSLGSVKQSDTEDLDPLKNFPTLFMYRQFIAIKDHITKHSGKSKEEAESIAAGVLWMSNQSFDGAELTGNNKQVRSFMNAFDSNKERFGLTKSPIQMLFTDQNERNSKKSLGECRYKFKVNKDGSVSSTVEKPITTAFFLRAQASINVPTHLRIESTFDGSSIKQTLQSDGVCASNISITEGPHTPEPFYPFDLD